MGLAINMIRHPDYSASILDWQKWRTVYQGGESFKNQYLEQMSLREDEAAFTRRKRITPIPRFAGAAIDEIANSITVRMPDIKRTGGSESYLEACAGLNGGVNQRGTGMNAFISKHIITEMLVFRRVGVFVDKPSIAEGSTLNNTKDKTPYLYYYPIEDIVSWDTYTTGFTVSYKTLLLREEYDIYDDDTGLPVGCQTRYRRLWINESGTVSFQFFTLENNPQHVTGEKIWTPTKEIRLKIKTIPFVEFAIQKSLMEDIADHQIALLNMESSDVAYSYGSNFPFYVEQYDPLEAQSHLKKVDAVDGTPVAKKEVQVGATHGRRYPKGLNQPDFINPSGEPLEVSMKKSEQLKKDIRQLVGLSVATLNPGRTSAESKGMDNQTLEAGLASIGLELQTGDQRIAKIWAEYDGTSPASVQYPTTYALVTDAERQTKASNQQKLQGAAPSKAFQKEIAKDIARTLFEHRVPHDVLVKMLTEIDAAKHITSDAEAIKTDVELGIVSEITASNARGYDGATEVPKARLEHAERAARIVTAQTAAAGTNKSADPSNPAARGVNDLSLDKGGAVDEKKDSQRTPDLNIKPGETKVRS